MKFEKWGGKGDEHDAFKSEMKSSNRKFLDIFDNNGFNFNIFLTGVEYENNYNSVVRFVCNNYSLICYKQSIFVHYFIWTNLGENIIHGDNNYTFELKLTK